MRPKWQDAPEWANWLAKDQRNDWYYCESEPLIKNNTVLFDGRTKYAGEYISPGMPLFIIERRDEGESRNIDAAETGGEVEIENRIGLREESIDWEAHKSFGRSL